MAILQSTSDILIITRILFHRLSQPTEEYLVKNTMKLKTSPAMSG